MEFIVQPMTWLFNYSGSNDSAEKQVPGKFSAYQADEWHPITDSRCSHD